MAKASGLSVSTVQRIWPAFGLQPHRTETFKLSTIQTSWPKCATLWAFTSGRRSSVSFYAWMRSPNPGAGPQPPCCRCVPASRPEGRMTTEDMAPHRCSPLSTLRQHEPTAKC